jgi:hypothetical protein
MSYQWIDDRPRARAHARGIRDDTRSKAKALGERRRDHHTAQKIRDALRARSVHAAAQALEHQRVDLATALRVLMRPERRRAGER